jgi:hypothetical protein
MAGTPRSARLGKGEQEAKMDVLDELKREGRVEGGARVLLRLLTARFGPVPAEAKARIVGATWPALVRWSLRVLTAPTLEAVLGRDTTARKTARKTAKKATPGQRALRRRRAGRAGQAEGRGAVRQGLARRRPGLARRRTSLARRMRSLARRMPSLARRMPSLKRRMRSLRDYARASGPTLIGAF